MKVTVKILALLKNEDGHYGWLIEQSLEHASHLVGEGVFWSIETDPIAIGLKGQPTNDMLHTDAKITDTLECKWNIEKMIQQDKDTKVQIYDTEHRQSSNMEFPPFPDGNILK